MIIRQLGQQPYEIIWEQMKQFTTLRNQDTPDEIWLLEHDPVYTQGQAGKAEHMLMPSNIPVVQSDRGGQITYHGPGQLIFYVLLDLVRLNLGVRKLVCQLEQTLIHSLHDFSIAGLRQVGAPGVYVDNRKIASVGLRVKKGCTYHGIALNVDMDLIPFQRINPCGYQGLHMTQIKEFYPNICMEAVKTKVLEHFLSILGVAA
jgi:lipoyl(octanoyl) transferase